LRIKFLFLHLLGNFASIERPIKTNNSTVSAAIVQRKYAKGWRQGESAGKMGKTPTSPANERKGEIV